MRINRKRLQDTMDALGRIGETPAGGLTRLALSDEDRRGRDLLVGWMREAGLRVSIDQMGNIMGVRPVVSGPPVMMGSHADSVPTGGKYDGQLGVLCALEAIRSLNDHDVKTRHPLGMIIFTNEEGARFQPAMIGSGVMAGKIPLEDAYNARDKDGLRLGDELERIGYLGSELCAPRPFRAYLELHIEQGPILDREAVPVGIVVGGYATRGMHVDVHGETAHAGPTPMDRRRNALVGAAMLAVAVNDVGWKYHDTEGKATVARLVAWPNKAGILSEYAQLTCDVRHADRAVADRMLAEVKAAIPECARRANVEMRVAGEWQFGNERFDPGCIRLIREAAQRLNVPHRDILSQAGHDAYYVSRVAPTAMIFTPCHNGISHNEAEHAELDYTSPGVNVLLHAVLARANR